MNSQLCYVGGKSKLSKIICEMIPEHKTYCEVFAGAAWVFFRKEPSRYEVINDRDSDLISFYRCIQNHLEEFLRQFKWLLASRELWNDFKRQAEVGGLTDIQRAARYYYLQRMCFGGRVRNRTFGTSPERHPKINLLRLEEEMSTIHLRLSQVIIEHLDYADVIKRYDKPGTFFYLDPPYYKAPFYEHNFYTLEDYNMISVCLQNIKGKFLLSLNDHDDIRKAFSCFPLKSVTVGYSLNAVSPSVGKELLISNYTT